MKRLVIFVVLPIFSCLSAAFAQGSGEDDLFLSYGGEEFISIATGTTQHISKAPAVATVITAKDIRDMGFTTFEEALASVPGLHVSLSSIRFTPTYHIRGIATDTNSQVLVLVNGVPLTQVYFGDRGINSTVPLSIVERIEVIRGPGSAVYGADAFSGVINVITKSAKNPGADETGMRYGSFETGRVWAQYGFEWSGLNFAFFVDGFKTDGDEDRIIETDLQAIFDSLSPAPAVSFAPGPVATREKRTDIRFEMASQHWTARLWNWQQKDLGTGPGLAQALDPAGRTNTDNWLLDFNYDKRIHDHVKVSALLSYMDTSTETQYTLFPANTILPIGPDGNVSPTGIGAPVVFTDGLIGNPAGSEEHLRADFVVLYSGIKNHSLRFSFGGTQAALDATETKNFGPGVITDPQPFMTVDGTLTDVTGTPYVFIEPEKRSVRHISVQDEWSYAADWTLTAGVRYDRYSDFGSTTNPRLALVWNTRHNLTTKFLYGRAFRAPAFAELFAINNPITLGNRSLDPEEIDTFEVAFDYRPSFDLRMGLNLFVYEISDLIQFVPDAGGASATAQNIGEQKGSGLEAEMEYRVTPRFDVKAYLAYQNSEDQSTGQPVPNTPAYQAYLNLKWKFFDGWHAVMRMKSVMGRERTPGDPREDVDDYTTGDLYFKKISASDTWDIGMGIQNFTDEKRFEPSPANLGLTTGSAVPGDYPLTGRSYYLEGRLRF